MLDEFSKYKAIIPVFTNVIFDTSQPHANTLFTDMFQWLDLVVKKAEQHPDTLFIIRAHPDETRPNKTSLETVQDWYTRNNVDRIKNIQFIPPHEFISSYELISLAKFVMIFNSTIGLEASLMGVPVLTAGRARFTQIPTVFYPNTQQEYVTTLTQFLASEKISVPTEFAENARIFLYFQLFKSSLPFGEFLEASVEPTQSTMKIFNPDDLMRSDSLSTIYTGMFENGDFLLDV
jgi:UDP-N-acetylglucosamine 2-epimerase